MNGIEEINLLSQEAEIAKFTPEELREYEDSLKAYRDIKNSIETARREGRAEGRAEGMAEGMAEGRAAGRTEGRAEEKAAIAQAMKAKGFPLSVISEVTGLPEVLIEIL